VPRAGGVSLRFRLLENPVERAKVEPRVTQLIEPVAERVHIRLQAVQFVRVVFVRLLLTRDQLPPPADLFA